MEETYVVAWVLICEREDISELECLMVSGITRLNDYGVLNGRGESCGKGLTYTNSKLRTYSGDFIKPEGMTEASFMYENQCLVVWFIVANTKSPNLLGRDVLRLLRLNWGKLLNVYYVEKNVRTQNCLNKILSDYKEVFKSEMGTLKGFEVERKIDPDCKPKFCKARPVTYALNERIEKELERLVKDNICESIQYSKWAVPGIFNQPSLCGKYPVSKTNDLFATLNSGEKFSKLDLSHAYQQLLLSPESSPLLPVNTHKSLFQPNC